MNVEDIMTSNPVSVSLDTSATRVRSILRDEDFRCIPVLNGDHLEGLITRGNMLNISTTKSNIEARGIMKKPKVILTPEMNIFKAAYNILSAAEIQAPVVESNNNLNLVGIVSVVDILRGLKEEGAEPYKKTLGDIKTKNVVSCDYQDLISKVWNQMDESGYSGLPVLKKGKLIGIITRKDLIKARHISTGMETEHGKRSIKVEKVMKTPTLVGTDDMLVDEAANLMILNDIGRLPVVKNPVFVKKEPNRSKESELVGIVSREDILGSYLS